MKKSDNRSIEAVVVTTGVASVVTQLLTIREFLSQFKGNEILIALILFNWLVFGGIGSLLGRRRALQSRESGRRRLAGLSLGLALLAGTQVMAIRLLRDAVFTHGASIGFYPVWAYSFFLILPYGLGLGFALPYSLTVLRLHDARADGTKIYILDNIGDIAGGALFSFALVYLLTPFQAVFAAQLPLLYFTTRLFPRRGRKTAVAAAWGIAACLMFFVWVEKSTLIPPEGRLAAYRESKFGRITVLAREGQMTLFSDGVPLFSDGDVAAAEESVHYPLSQLDRVGEVLVISAEGRMMQELAKHRPAAVDYVELDPDISRILLQYDFIREVPWLRVLHMDARKFLAETEKRYDAILVNLPEPETYQMNRFFTDRFFQLARKRLRPEGVMSFAMEGFDSYLGDIQRKKISSVYRTAADNFRFVQMFPGQKLFFLCADRPIDRDIPGRLRTQGIETDYIEGYFHGDVTADRVAYLASCIDPAAPRNRDAAPYLMRVMFQQWFDKFQSSPTILLVVLGVLTPVYLVWIRREAFVLFATGCINMSSEILIIFACQMFFGYVYFKIGMIVTVFLAGLLPGAWWGNRFPKSGRRLLVWTECLLAAAMGLLAAFFRWGGDRLPESSLLVVGFGISLLCGMQFPAVLRFGQNRTAAAAQAFSADLTGAAVGILATSLFFIPTFGIVDTAVFLIVLKLISLMVVLKTHEPLQS